MGSQENLWKHIHYDLPIKGIDKDGEVVDIMRYLEESDATGLVFMAFGEEIYKISNEKMSFNMKTSQNKQETYDILELYYFWENRNRRPINYIRTCRLKKLTPVSVVMKTTILPFFENPEYQEIIISEANSKKYTLEDVCLHLFGNMEKLDELKHRLSETVVDNVHEMCLIFTAKPLYEQQEIFHDTKEEWARLVSQTQKKLFSTSKKINERPRLQLAIEPDTLMACNIDGQKGNRQGNTDLSENRIDKREQHNGPFNFVPIIVVPDIYSAMINIGNAKEFLSKGIYKPHERSHNVKRVVKFVRKIDGLYSRATYMIVDQAYTLSPTEWKRVVAIFVHGMTWQFKRWIYEDPIKLFRSYCGFYLRYNTQTPSDQVRGWNVHQLVIGQDDRHLDKIVCKEFWEIVDKWITKTNFIEKGNSPHSDEDRNRGYTSLHDN